MATSIQFPRPLTVGDLRKMLEGRHDQEQILIASPPRGDEGADWYNVGEVALPDQEAESGDDEYAAITLFPVDTYDSRQF